ncbi:hypothetical protein K0M31_011375 [Melipona bicolor]|uniref:Uncharacterized protein n=1 Tax=Melipona bicolor TaxID=60889 RepID=A0AA40G9E9_9HYME|nr:hypothetical protein K0M31_011375 [Melipona bicolor]
MVSSMASDSTIHPVLKFLESPTIETKSIFKEFARKEFGSEIKPPKPYLPLGRNLRGQGGRGEQAGWKYGTTSEKHNARNVESVLGIRQRGRTSTRGGETGPSVSARKSFLSERMGEREPQNVETRKEQIFDTRELHDDI